MEILDFKTLINKVHCGKTSSFGFSEEDFDNIKACISEVTPIEVDEFSPNIELDTSQIDCMSSGIDEIQKIIEDQKKNIIPGIHQTIVRSKVNELKDNLEIIKFYYNERYQTALELNNLANNQGFNAVREALQKIQPLPILSPLAKNLIQKTFSKLSNQLIVNFWGIGSGFPIRTTTIDFRLINLDQIIINLINPETNESEKNTILIKDSEYLINDIFKSYEYFNIINQEAYDPNSSNNPPIEESDYDSLLGLLYTGIEDNDYIGLYKKLAKPLKYLFTLEERGLSLDSEQVDPVLKDIQDAPTTLVEDDITYYIADQQVYESFYENLKDEYNIRVEKEKSVVYPNITSPILEELSNLAKREAADAIRTRLLLGFDNILEYFLINLENITSILKKVNSELENLNNLISNNILDESQIGEKISEIPCFTEAANLNPQTAPECENSAKEKLGEDPLYLRTLNSLNFGLPDIGSQCYWKEFAKSLNKISLLPFPDLTGPPPANLGFRYWPINCILPAGPALALITVPPIWKPLFVIPTAVGTLVCFLNFPIAPIGIPLPSIYLFYFAPDGTKYLVLATNLPSLWSNTKNLLFGFELDNSSNSQNPIGLTASNPYKGYLIKGSLIQPLFIGAALSKADRLTKIAADLASGKNQKITNINGEELPFSMKTDEYSKFYKSDLEIMKEFVDAKPSDEFFRELDNLKGTINRQLTKLGEMQTSNINQLRERLRIEKVEALKLAQKETALNKKRIEKYKARRINTITLNEKIESTLADFNKHIENIKFGTITFPKDPTKNNPGLPEAITSILDLITLASLGDLKIEKSALSLNHKMKQAIGNIDMSNITNKQFFDISTDSGLFDIQQALHKIVDETLNYLKGKDVSFDVSMASNETEKAEIIKSNKERQQLAKESLSFTALGLLNLPKIQIFDFSKKCCEISTDSVFTGIPPLLTIAFSSLSTFMHAIINELDEISIKNILGLTNSKVQTSFLLNVFDNLVISIPNVSLPNPANLLILIQAFLMPILLLISIPKAINPLQPIIVPMTIPLDTIIKPIFKSLVPNIIESIFKLIDEVNTVYNLDGTIKKIEKDGIETINLSNSNKVFSKNESDVETTKQIFSVSCGIDSTLSIIVNSEGVPTGQRITFDTADGTSSTTDPVFNVILTLNDDTSIELLTLPLLALDTKNYFHLITGNDIIEFIRTIINAVYSEITKPLFNIVKLLSNLMVSLNSFSFNIIEAAIPNLSLLKLAKILIDSIIPPSMKVKIINEDAFKIIQDNLIPNLEKIEPVLKEVAWLGTIALCSLSSPVTNWLPTLGARLLHPIMNSDDLPPWERLTYKNPLFAIFLDEIAWRGSMYATGSLIFQSKTPALLPYSPTFPIVHITPHLV